MDYLETDNSTPKRTKRGTATIDYNVAVLRPLLIKEWHPTKNVGVERTLWDVTPGSRLKVWWLCSQCGHEWIASIRRRAGKGVGCPRCADKIRGAKNSHPSEGQSLAEIYPELAREWHPTANDRSPQEVKPGANYRATWRCISCGNVWQAHLWRRIRGKGRCKRCESLGEKHPELLEEWHPTLNEKSPYAVKSGSNYRAVWRCKKEGHVWESSIHHRTISGSGCPECARSSQAIRQRRPSDGQSLAEAFPDIAEEWHPTDNVDEFGRIMTAYDVGPGSGYRAKWICSRGHEWETLVHVRTGGASCPKCRPKASRIETRLYVEMKAIFGEVIRGKPLGRKSIDIYMPKYRIGIEYDGNHWHEAKIDHDMQKGLEALDRGITLFRVREKGLEQLSERDILLKGGEKTFSIIKKLLKTLLASDRKFSVDDTQVIKDYLKRKDFLAEEDYQEVIQHFPGPTPSESLAHLNPELMSEWDFESNKLLRPENVRPGTEEEAWWKCEHGHRWKAPIKFRARGGGACAKCRSLAFLYPELAEEWHSTKNKMSPWDCHARSSKRVWWKCKTCGVDWEAGIANRSGGGGCPTCKSVKQSARQRRPMPGASLGDVRPDLASEWHPTLNRDSEGERITPWDVRPSSSFKFWWICKQCGFAWNDSPSHRNHGRGCPSCAAKRRGLAKARPKPGESLGELYPEIGKDWDTEKNDRSPYEVKRGSGYRAAWKCDACGHRWVARVMDRTINGAGCPACARRKKSGI